MKLLYPDYSKCLVNLSNSILKYFNIEPYNDSLKELDNVLEEHDYNNVVLILNDGLGSKVLDKNLSKDSFLRKNKLMDITSVFPATTVAATTSVITGLCPIEHGLLGWYSYIRDIDKVIVTYLNNIKHTDIQAADFSIMNKYYNYKSIMDLINDTGIYKAYGVSPYLDTKYGLDNPDDMYNIILNLCNKRGKKFIYCYYNEPDHLMHELGVNNIIVKDKIKYINNKIEELSNKLKDTLIIVTADHGLVDTKYIFIENYSILQDTLIRETSIEPRATTYFVKNNKKDIFVEEFNKHFKKDFILLTKEEVIQSNLFGYGTPNRRFESSLGDYLSISISNKCIKDLIDTEPFKANHSGITEDEVKVPIIIKKIKR